MAGEESNISQNDQHSLQTIEKFLWGDNVRLDIFIRWTKGFSFSAEEPTALVQTDGGPCGILAPVQAHILKSIITSKAEGDNWREADSDAQNTLLINAVCEILSKAREREEIVFVHVDNIRNINEESIFSDFHSHLMYGMQTLEQELGIADESLIDSNHGYGSQAITNLMITGTAVPHVFDDNRDIDGLALCGISQQSDIGFLSLLEPLRYCEVGLYLKKPSFPIWVLGSETHLTVLFSFDRRLAKPETSTDIAKRVFKQFDPDGNGFISSDLLGDVLSQLDLVCDEEYVKIMANKLDPEKYGIIMMTTFLEEFFPDLEERGPDTFTLYHYNGQPQAHPDNKVKYVEGCAILLECNIRCINDSNPMLTCLQTRWPSIDVAWKSATTPSLN